MWRPIEQAPRNTSILVSVDPNDPDTYSMACVMEPNYVPAIVNGNHIDLGWLTTLTVEGMKYFFDFSASAPKQEVNTNE
jgi:hypothetical protein